MRDFFYSYHIYFCPFFMLKSLMLYRKSENIYLEEVVLTMQVYDSVHTHASCVVIFHLFPDSWCNL